MRILFVTQSLAPFQTGSAASDVTEQLAKSLSGLEHEVTVLSPLFSSIDPTKHSLARRLSKLKVKGPDGEVEFETYDGRTAGGVEVVFLGNKEHFGSVERFETDSAGAKSAGLFAKAACAYLAERTVDAIHVHDWVGAAFLVQQKKAQILDDAGTVLTVHEPVDPGFFAAADAPLFGLTADDLEPEEQDGQFSLLRLGLLRAGRAATVSPTYARELKSSGEPPLDALSDVLKDLGDRWTGLLNGVDSAVWNPATDPKLSARYDPMDLRGKARCKTAMQMALGFDPRPEVPLLGVLASPDPTEGYDLLLEAAPAILRNDCQLAVVYEGDPEHPMRIALEDLATRFPDRLQVQDDDGDLAHEVLAAADLVLVPSRAEPCGDLQMRAHRYGALPIAHRTGGLADTVVDCDSALQTGTGFTFDTPESDDLLSAVRRSFSAFTKGREFEALKKRVMRIDYSWDRSARLYERLYRQN